MRSHHLISLLFVLVYRIPYISPKITGRDYALMPDIFQFEDYDKCLCVSPENEPAYCSITVQLQPEKSENFSKVWSIIQKVSSNDRNYRHDLLRHGICASEQCSNYNGTLSECLNETYNKKYKSLGLTSKINSIQCEKKNSERDMGNADVVIIAILGTYIVFIIVTTIWLEKEKYQARDTDGIDVNQKKTSIRSFLSMFSFVDNLSSLTIVKSKTKNYSLFVETVRFTTSIVVIFVHTIGAFKGSPILNPRQAEKNTISFINLFYSNSGMTIQVFFVISSWLLAANFFRKLKSEGKVGLGYVVRLILRRYIRFATAQMVLIALHATCFVHLSRGPFWEAIMGTEYKACREKWWTNFLFVKNFFIEKAMCSVHMWYLSVDFQFTVLGLLILWLTQKKPRNLFLASGFVVAFHVIFMFTYLAWNNFEFTVLVTPELFQGLKFLSSKEWQATWTSTYSNLPGLPFGLLCGYLQINYQKGKFCTKRKHTILWWMITALLVLGTPLSTCYYMTTDYYSNSRWFAAAYGCMAKALFALGVGLLIFGVSQGFQGFIWLALTLRLGQLSFGAYVTHFTVVEINAGVRRKPRFFSEYDLACDTIVNIVLSYLSSIILTVFVLTPVDKLCRKLV